MRAVDIEVRGSLLCSLGKYFEGTEMIIAKLLYFCIK